MSTNDRDLPDVTVFRDAPAAPEMVVMPRGSFLMGADGSEPGSIEDERPLHEVRLDHRFAIGRFAVTVEEYLAFCAATGTRPPGSARESRRRHPVVDVSWHEACAYAAWLATLTGRPYRLPTEAEWEYAARAGRRSVFSWGDEPDPALGNFDGNIGHTVPVGSYPANPWGLHDMTGNSWDWCLDSWHDGYEGAPTDGSAWAGDETGDRRILRGGSWFSPPFRCRCAYRARSPVDRRDGRDGFRLARTLAD